MKDSVVPFLMVMSVFAVMGWGMYTCAHSECLPCQAYEDMTIDRVPARCVKCFRGFTR